MSAFAQTVLLSTLRVSIAIACGASLWSALAVRCRTCKAASGLAGGLPLGWIGAGLYAAVLALTFLHGMVAAAWILAAAGGAHVALMGILLRFRVVCRACLITAAAALAACVLTIVLAPQTWPALFALPAAAALAWWTITAVQKSAARRSAEQSQHLLADAARQTGPVPPGMARLVIMSKPNCEPCKMLETTILPALVAEFKDALQVEHQEAAKGIPAPTLLVLGQVSTPLMGLPPPEMIGMAIRMALGQMPGPGFPPVPPR